MPWQAATLDSRAAITERTANDALGTNYLLLFTRPRIQAFILPKNKYFEIRPSRIVGQGAFATRKIRSGTRISEYTGEIISDEEADRRYPDDDTVSHHTFLFAVGWGKTIDAAVNGGDARYINHSCDPNCEAHMEKRRIFIDAIRTIHPGEELCYDYQYKRDGESDAEARRMFPCHCGSATCRGTIMAPLPRPRRKRRRG